MNRRVSLFALGPIGVNLDDPTAVAEFLPIEPGLLEAEPGTEGDDEVGLGE